MTVVTLSNVAYAPGAYGPLFSLFSILKENEAKASFDSQRNGYTVQCKSARDCYAQEMNGYTILLRKIETVSPIKWYL